MTKSTAPLVAIVGPTASGKTDRGLALAKQQNGEIISVDSRQVYRYLSIGTAKPQGRWNKNIFEVNGIPYHLVDFIEPSVRFSAADFVRRAHETLTEVQSRGKTPIFVGGTGLYFKVLTEGLAELPPADDRLRSRLKKEAETKGRAHLHARLKAFDPEASLKIPVNNIQRLVRALEIYELTGKPISHWHKNQKKQGLAITFKGIDLPREELHRRIEARCRAMMEEGIMEETRAVLNQGYSESCPALTGLGYPRVIAYLKGKLSKAECLRLLTQDTRQYAKRQMTYFRHQLPVQWSAFAEATADHPPKQIGTA